MEELISILKLHHDLYPKMQFEDVYKLFFQHCYGPKHMSMSYKDILSSIREESVQILSEDNKIIDIGNGLIRVPISKDMDVANKIADSFFKSIQTEYKEIDFENILVSLKEYVCDLFLFDKKDYDSKVDLYRKIGFPAISHSEIYKKSYNPHYRVVRKFLYDL